MKKNEIETKKGVSRREFLSLSALGLAGLTIMPSWAIQGVRIAPSDRVVMGFIGLGRQALSDFRSFQGSPGFQVAACCDVDTMKVTRFQNSVREWQKSRGMNERCDGYEYYEELLNRRDIDAVEVVTPDHWHFLQSLHAMEAGKDVYVQKPLTYTIVESLAMVEAKRRYKKVVQCGSQQRSSEIFQVAIKLVQDGAIGHIEKIYAKVGDPPKPLDLPEEKVPANLNWNNWMGPLNDPKIHYHPDLAPPITLNPVRNETLWGAWRWYSETGNGYYADWGAHHFDISQAAIGMDGSGPVEFTPVGVNGAKYATFKYANGIIMTEQPFVDEVPNSQGIKFWGTKGWIEVSRSYLGCSDPSLVPERFRNTTRPAPRPEGQQAAPAQPQQQQRAQTAPTTTQAAQSAQAAGEVSSPHMQNFIDCVRSRQNPIAPVEVGASTNILCCIATMAHELRRVIKWDPATHSFGNDKDAFAHRLYQYEYRRPYCTPTV